MNIYVSYAFKNNGTIAIGACNLDTSLNVITQEDFPAIKEKIESHTHDKDIMILSITKLPIK